MDIETLKAAFRDEYNPSALNEVALKAAMGAAGRRSKLYPPNSQNRHAAFKALWARELETCAMAFVSPPTISQYESIITALKQVMNRHMQIVFGVERFLLSHSQKGISVYVKHLWCMGKVPEPPICPIDRRILLETGLRRHEDVKWTHVDTMDLHREKFAHIVRAAKREKLSVAVWELCKFEAIRLKYMTGC